MTNNKPKNSKGFTLPEVLISIGLFSVTIAVTSAIFLIGLRSQRQIIAAVNANDNLSYAIEVMARDIRTGNTFFAPIEEEISFLNSKNQAVIYRLNDETVEQSVAGASFEPLTSENIRITKLSFKVNGEGRYDNKQTKITIIMQVNSRFGNQDVNHNVQTTISARALEI